jgi:hypothetical protein
MLAGDGSHELEHLRVRDPIELGSEFEGVQRIEIGGLRDFALRDSQQSVEESELNARKARKARRDLEQVGHRVPQDEERQLRRILRERLAHQACAGSIVREHRLEVTLKDERSVSLGEEETARLNDATQRFADHRGVLTEVLGNDRGSSWGPRVVSWVREASEAFQQDLELEEVLDFSFDRDASQPCFARLGLLSPQASRIAQEVVIRVSLLATIEIRDGHDYYANPAPGPPLLLTPW